MAQDAPARRRVTAAARGSRPAIATLAALALEAALLLWPATMLGQAFFRRDVHLMWTAQAEAYAQGWSPGGWPLWNPLASFGQPLLEDANAQVLYPPTILLRALRPWTYYTLYAFAHLLLAGAGAAALARRLGLRSLAAWAAGALWMASGPLLSLVDTWNQLAGAAWMPWAIAAGLTALAERRARPALAWAACTALQVLAGAPEMALLAAAGLLAMAAAQVRRRHLRREVLVPVAAGALLASGLAVGLAAGQWAPALDAARRAGRTELSREARTHWSVHPLNLAQAVCPAPLHRLPLRAEARQELFGAPDPFLPSLYLGAVVAALAAAALARGTRIGLGLLLAVLFAVLIALGRHFVAYDALVALAPPLRAFRYPAKALLLAALCASLLAASGLSALADAGTRARRTVLAVAAGLGILSGGLAAAGLARALPLGSVLADSSTATLRSLASRLAVAAVLSAAAALVAWRGRRGAPWLAALALADLGAAHFDLNPAAPVALYRHVPAAAAAARDDAGGRVYAYDYQEPGWSQRYLGRDVGYELARAPEGWDLRAAQALALREALFPPSPATAGLEGSYDRDVPGLEPPSLALLKDAFRHAPPAAQARLLRIGAVSRVAALHDAAGPGLVEIARPGGYFLDPVRVLAVTDALPRAYVVGGARVHADDRSALATLLSPTFDPRREVVLAGGPGGAVPADFAGRATVRELRGDRVRLEVVASAPGWLVLVDAWSPGWRAQLDGRPAPLDRANVAFRAVPVPAGRHQVEMRYRPSGLAPALWVSAGSAAVALATAWLARKRA